MSIEPKATIRAKFFCIDVSQPDNRVSTRFS